jgi:hypothetical protein
MNASLSSSDNALLRAWRLGQLDPSAADAFETRLFFEPGLAEAARLDQGLAAGLAAGAANEPRLSSTVPQPNANRPWSMLLAAGLGALAVLPFAGQQSSPTAVGNIEWVSVDVRRGAEDALLVAPRADAELVVIELPAPSAGGGPFDLRLTTLADGQVALSIDGLLASSDGLLSLAMARDALPAGDYRIEIVAADGIAVGESLRIRYQPGSRAPR